MQGHLSDIGYNATEHDQRIDQLKHLKPQLGLDNIEHVIDAVVWVYSDLYGQTPYDINCGNCEEFAHDVVVVIAGEESNELFAAWHDEMQDCTPVEADWWAHKFIVYNGRYYDSEAPEGVDEWRQLPSLKNNPVRK